MSAAAPAAASFAPRRLIVTADDLGYAPERDCGIIRGFECGVITQASVSQRDLVLLVTGPSAAEAVKLAQAARRNPLVNGVGADASHGLPLGLHFNLTEGVALSDSRTFLGKEGFWAASRSANFADLTPFIQSELRAQLDAFRALVGHEPEYVDGHNHVHVIPSVASALLSELPPRGIRFVRCPQEDLSAANEMPPAQRTFLEEVSKLAAAARVLWSSPSEPQHRLVTSPAFVGLRLMGRANSAERLRGMVRSLPAGLTEYMCHPGHPSLSGDDFSRSIDRQHELDLLCDPELLETITAERVELTSWSSSELLRASA